MCCICSDPGITRIPVRFEGTVVGDCAVQSCSGSVRRATSLPIQVCDTPGCGCGFTIATDGERRALAERVGYLLDKGGFPESAAVAGTS
ncbi:MAG: hypothetical protein WC734_04070 [Patescibacteria group bacterium]